MCKTDSIMGWPFGLLDFRGKVVVSSDKKYGEAQPGSIHSMMISVGRTELERDDDAACHEGFLASK